ncbi:MAG: alpha/beta fold hydrolase [Myxococcales bacterium]|nr:alpha/beta fold hydrolase [Myxococcales bacterium]
MRLPSFPLIFALLAAGSLAVGCGSDGDGTQQAAVDATTQVDGSVDGAANDAASDAGEPDAGPQKPEVKWGACAGTYQGIKPECATLQLPYDYAKPDGDKLPVHVARVKATKPRRGALWLLQGGPGGDGSGLAQVAAEFAKKVPDLDLYLPDHRGTGLSDRLGCDKQEGDKSIGGQAIVSFEWQQCIKAAQEKWGDKLNHFTPSNASRDLHAWIDAVREGPEDPVFIYGVSYGTYWAHRYMQIFPKQPTAIVLDSVCPPGECVGDKYDTAFNEVAKSYLKLCGEDTFCSSKLGKDPWKKLGDLYTKLETGKHCPSFTQNVGPIQLRSLLSGLLRQFQFRAVIPALIYRLNRCDKGDEAVLTKVLYLMQYMGGGFMPNYAVGKTFSELLNAHILMSEMWSDPAPTYKEVQSAFLKTYVAPGATQNTLLLFDKWPKYKRDMYVNKFAETDVPVLMLNGTLDPQTPDFYAVAMDKGLKASNKQLVLMKGAAHGTVSQAPTFSGGMCGMDLAGQFFTDPTKPLDKTCVTLLLPVSFTLPSYMVKQFLGVNDLFENDGKTDDIGAKAEKLPGKPWSPVPGLPRWQ